MATRKKTPPTSPAASRALVPLPGTLQPLGDTTRLDKLTRVGSDSIVTVDGVRGVFTPVGAKDGQPLGSDERKNLQTVIDELRKEVGRLQSDTLQLAVELAALRERPSAPDDFASAVQQSLDEVQQRMATMRNSMSNFAVREFKLEADVFVQVSPLGSIEYRFVQPGDNINPTALSKLSLHLVPVPKNNLAGVWTPNFFQPELGLAGLPDLQPTQLQRLEAAGLFSIGELLQIGTRARAQAYLEALLGTERKRLALWAQQAALMTLRGVNGGAAMVLIDAGFGSFDALAATDAATLAKAYARLRRKHPEWSAPAADAVLALQWVRAARQYLGLPELPELPVTES
ncbi:MAG TPA: DUF4332 domain-containing protein [Albitalea sp.]|nr:DUF4332 domain-containing protein [Albitalea sp.]